LKRELLKALYQLLKRELHKARRRRSTGLFVLVFLTIAIFAIKYHLQEHPAEVPDKGTRLLCQMYEIADGDTATVGCKAGRIIIRLWGIDAPEMGQKPWGNESKEFLQYLLAGKQVLVEVLDKDRYGRAVARLFSGGEDAGLIMVREGKAVVYEQYNDSTRYYDAQQQAKTGQLGVWSEPGAQQKPSEWRKVNPNSRRS
jgi:endonuclease YncB( thermonuclease family)